jgi:hypothetical protein
MSCYKRRRVVFPASADTLDEKGRVITYRRVPGSTGKSIADNLTKAGWSWGCVATVDREGRTIFVADAHRDDGRRFIVHADEKLTAFIELERQVLTVTFYLESIKPEN